MKHSNRGDLSDLFIRNLIRKFLKIENKFLFQLLDMPFKSPGRWGQLLALTA